MWLLFLQQVHGAVVCGDLSAEVQKGGQIQLTNCSIIQNQNITLGTTNYTMPLFAVSGVSSIVFNNVLINGLASNNSFMLFDNSNLEVYFSNVRLQNFKFINSTTSQDRGLMNVKSFAGSYVFINESQQNISSSNISLALFTTQTAQLNNFYIQLNASNLTSMKIVNYSKLASLNNIQLNLVGNSSNFTFSWGNNSSIILNTLLVNWTGISNNSQSNLGSSFCPQIDSCYQIQNSTSDLSRFYNDSERFFIKINSDSEYQNNQVFLRENNFQNVFPNELFAQRPFNSGNIPQTFCIGPGVCFCGGDLQEHYCQCGNGNLEYNGACISPQSDTDGNLCVGDRFTNCASCGIGFSLVQYSSIQTLANYSIQNKNVTYNETHVYNKCVKVCGASCLNKQDQFQLQQNDCECQCPERVIKVGNQCMQQCSNDSTGNVTCQYVCEDGYAFSTETQRCLPTCKNCINGNAYITGSDLFYTSCSRGFTLKDGTCTATVGLNKGAVIASAIIIIIALAAASGIVIGYFLYMRKLTKEKLDR